VSSRGGRRPRTCRRFDAARASGSAGQIQWSSLPIRPALGRGASDGSAASPAARGSGALSGAPARAVAVADRKPSRSSRNPPARAVRRNAPLPKGTYEPSRRRWRRASAWDRPSSKGAPWPSSRRRGGEPANIAREIPFAGIEHRGEVSEPQTRFFVGTTPGPGNARSDLRVATLPPPRRKARGRSASGLATEGPSRVGPRGADPRSARRAPRRRFGGRRTAWGSCSRGSTGSGGKTTTLYAGGSVSFQSPRHQTSSVEETQIGVRDRRGREPVRGQRAFFFFFLFFFFLKIPPSRRCWRSLSARPRTCSWFGELRRYETAGNVARFQGRRRTGHLVLSTVQHRNRSAASAVHAPRDIGVKALLAVER